MDLIGQRFNKLIVVEELGLRKRPCGKNVKLWKCLCDCGNYTVVDTSSLRRNHTKSCGCLTLKHGLTKTRIHQIWASMRKRCHNPNTKQYKDYGGRGIGICAEWDDDENGFVNFLSWAQDNGYSDNLTLDRIDVNGNYTPENCRWATKIEQARNTRYNKMITYKGETKCLKEWSEIIGINYGTLLSRLDRSKWSVEKAFETPLVRHYNK